MHIGKILKEVREKKNLTQKEVAEKLGCTKTVISRIENNSNIKWKTLIRICEKGLGVKWEFNIE